MANPIPQAKLLVGGLKSHGHLDLETPDGYGATGTFLDRGGAQHDVRAYGAVLDGMTGDENALADAITAAQASGIKVVTVAGGTALVGSSITAPKGVTLRVLEGAQVKPANGVTLTINGSFEAGLYQVFDTSAGGSVVFSAGAVERVLPQWWGAKGDEVTDDTAAIQAALDAAPSKSTIVFPPGKYRTGLLTISKPLRIVSEGASLVGIGNAFFAVISSIDWLHIEGINATFPDATGTTGKEFFVNATVSGTYGENRTTYGTYTKINEIGRLTIRDCRLDIAKITVISGDGSTAVNITGNQWQHEGGVGAAPYYLYVHGVRHPVIRDNEWRVYPPDGDNRDIVKISGTASDALVSGNLFHNQNTACLQAAVDLYTGGARAIVTNNHFINCHLHPKAWGSDVGGIEYGVLRIQGNTFVREAGYRIRVSVGTSFEDAFIYLINTRFSVESNQFIDLESTSARIAALLMDNTPNAFDNLGTTHCKMFAVRGNLCDFSAGHPADALIHYDNTDSGDTAVHAIISDNLQVGGQAFIRHVAQRMTDLVLAANIWTDNTASPEGVGVDRPCTAVANVFPSDMGNLPNHTQNLAPVTAPVVQLTGSTTLDVGGYDSIRVQSGDGNPVTITGLTGGRKGQVVTLIHYSSGVSITLKNSSSVRLAGNMDFTTNASRSSITLRLEDAEWIEIGRSER